MRVLVCLAAVLLAIPACASPEEVALSTEAATSPAIAPSPAASATPAPTEVESTTAPPAPTATPTETASEKLAESPTPGPPVELWFLRDTQRRSYIEPELHRLPAPTQAVARATMELLVAAEARDPALDNVVPEGSRVLGVTLKDGLLTVDLDFPNDGAGLGIASEGALFRAIAHTGTQFSTVRRVRVLEEGRVPPSGYVTDADGPYRYDERVVSPVVVEQPRHREPVDAGSVTVRGTANVYEATVVLRLRDPGGKVVEETFTTATCGTGCRGTWEHTFEGLTAPGRWTLGASATDPSDGEGPPPYTVKRTFVVE